MAEMYMGQLLPFAGNFVIRGTAAAKGSLLSISQNTALFSILGTTYGGDGQVTFGLPNLQGRSPIGAGLSTLGTTYDLGEVGGTENVTLTSSNMPTHTHLATTSGLAVDTTGLTVNTSGLTATLKASGSAADSPDPTGALAQSTNNTNIYQDGGVPAIALAAGSVAIGGSATIGGSASVSGNVTIGLAGGSQPFQNTSPYQAITWLIVMNGIFPSRS